MSIRSYRLGDELAAEFAEKPIVQPRNEEPHNERTVRQIWNLARECCSLTPSKKASVQLARSLVVSVIALAADFSTMVALKEIAGMYYLLAATIGFGVGVIVNYLLSVAWVFADRKLASKHAEFVIFVVICAVGLALNLAIIAGLVKLAHIDYRAAKAVSTVVVFFWNFIARKKVLY